MKLCCKRIFALLLVLIFSVATLSLPVLAAKEVSVLTIDNLEGDFAVLPGSQLSDTDLFSSFKEVMPGDMREENIEIRNETKEKRPVRLFLCSMTPVMDTEDPSRQETLDDLLSMLTLRVHAGDQLILDATASDTLAEPVSLGVVPYRDSADLQVELTVPVDVNNEQAELLSDVEWIFQVEDAGSDSSVPDHSIPQTGDGTLLIMWIVLCAGSFGGLIWIFLCRKTRKKK